jgi:FixJ family two-component response regulator
MIVTLIEEAVGSGARRTRACAVVGLSVRTVEKHRANIMVKLGVREVASLVRCCVQAGIVPG